MCKDKMSVSIHTADDDAGRWLSILEAKERASMPDASMARKSLARRLGVLPGTLENISRGRVKGVRVWIAERIRAAVIGELEREISRLSHELLLARQGGARPDSNEVLSSMSALAAARRLINEASQ